MWIVYIFTMLPFCGIAYILFNRKILRLKALEIGEIETSIYINPNDPFDHYRQHSIGTICIYTVVLLVFSVAPIELFSIFLKILLR